MAKVIAAMNVSIDGYCDHTKGIPDEELHRHYTDLLRRSVMVLYGRTTYQLMEYWRDVLRNPTGVAAMDEFAQVMDAIPKVVFSKTLQNVDWHSARIAQKSLEEETTTAVQQYHGSILVGSPGLISQLSEFQLIDEYQLCIHPVFANGGPRLFRDAVPLKALRLCDTKRFASGVMMLQYEKV